MRNIYELGSKTGLKKAELRKAAKFGLLGLITLALTALAACFKNGKTVSRQQEPASQAIPQPAPQNVRQQPTLQDLVDNMDKSTGTATTPGGKCGPYPGYPCGTRYYTVSAGDFERA